MCVFLCVLFIWTKREDITLTQYTLLLFKHKYIFQPIDLLFGKKRENIDIKKETKPVNNYRKNKQ